MFKKEGESQKISEEAAKNSEVAGAVRNQDPKWLLRRQGESLSAWKARTQPKKPNKLAQSKKSEEKTDKK